MLCCAVLCCAVLCCVVLCCVVLCCVVLCCVVLCCVVLCCAVLFSALHCSILIHYVIPSISWASTASSNSSSSRVILAVDKAFRNTVCILAASSKDSRDE